MGGPDLARRLTERGEKQARRVAEWLHSQLPESARILVSPAVRAQQTARALADIGHRRLRTVDAIGPGASVREVLEAADWPHAKTPVILVGHQPTFGHVASFLMAGDVRDWAIKKAGVWWLSSRERDAEEQTVLRAVIGPDLL